MSASSEMRLPALPRPHQRGLAHELYVPAVRKVA